MEVYILLKFLLETRLKSKPFDLLTSFLVFLVQKLELSNLVKLSIYCFLTVTFEPEMLVKSSIDSDFNYNQKQ